MLSEQAFVVLALVSQEMEFVTSPDILRFPPPSPRH